MVLERKREGKEKMTTTTTNWKTIITDEDPQDAGFICKQCGGPQPLGIGYVLDGHDAYKASAAMTAPCDCATR